MGVQGEVEVPPQLLDGAATPVLKHVQVDTAAELRGWGGVSVRQRPGLPSPAPHCSRSRSTLAPFPSSAPWLHGLTPRPGLFFLALHVFTRRCTHACTCTHTHIHSRLFPHGKGAGLHPPGKGVTGRTEWWEGGPRLGFSRFAPLPFGLVEKDMATHSSILAWRIPQTEEPGGVGDD